MVRAPVSATKVIKPLSVQITKLQIINRRFLVRVHVRPPIGIKLMNKHKSKNERYLINTGWIDGSKAGKINQLPGWSKTIGGLHPTEYAYGNAFWQGWHGKPNPRTGEKFDDLVKKLDDADNNMRNFLRNSFCSGVEQK